MQDGDEPTTACPSCYESFTADGGTTPRLAPCGAVSCTLCWGEQFETAAPEGTGVRCLGCFSFHACDSVEELPVYHQGIISSSDGEPSATAAAAADDGEEEEFAAAAAAAGMSSSRLASPRGASDTDGEMTDGSYASSDGSRSPRRNNGRGGGAESPRGGGHGHGRRHRRQADKGGGQSSGSKLLEFLNRSTRNASPPTSAFDGAAAAAAAGALVLSDEDNDAALPRCQFPGCNRPDRHGIGHCPRHVKPASRVSVSTMVDQFAGTELTNVALKPNPDDNAGVELLLRRQSAGSGMAALEPAAISERFQRQERLELGEAVALIEGARTLLKEESNRLWLPAPATVVGDLHGQYFDLLNILRRWRPDHTLLFLGDYVDRGAFSCEVILHLLALKIKYPKQVYLIRGNHECDTVSSHFGFKAECKAKYGLTVFYRFLLCFQAMPLCAILETARGNVFTCHGGISPNIGTLEDIDTINRFSEPEVHGALCDLLWADPANEEEVHKLSEAEYQDFLHLGFTANPTRGCSYMFGYKAVSDFLQNNNLAYMIRAHEVQEEGFRSHFTQAPGVDAAAATAAASSVDAVEATASATESAVFEASEEYLLEETDEEWLSDDDELAGVDGGGGGADETAGSGSGGGGCEAADVGSCSGGGTDLAGGSGAPAGGGTGPHRSLTVLTVFSAPNYCDRYGNKAAILHVEASGHYTVNLLEAEPHPRPRNEGDVNVMQLLAMGKTCPYMPTNFREFVKVAVEMGPAVEPGDCLDDAFGGGAGNNPGSRRASMTDNDGLSPARGRGGSNAGSRRGSLSENEAPNYLIIAGTAAAERPPVLSPAVMQPSNRPGATSPGPNGLDIDHIEGREVAARVASPEQAELSAQPSPDGGSGGVEEYRFDDDAEIGANESNSENHSGDNEHNHVFGVANVGGDGAGASSGGNALPAELAHPRGFWQRLRERSVPQPSSTGDERSPNSWTVVNANTLREAAGAAAWAGPAHATSGLAAADAAAASDGVPPMRPSVGYRMAHARDGINEMHPDVLSERLNRGGGGSSSEAAADPLELPVNRSNGGYGGYDGNGLDSGSHGLASAASSGRSGTPSHRSRESLSARQLADVLAHSPLEAIVSMAEDVEVVDGDRGGSGGGGGSADDNVNLPERLVAPQSRGARRPSSQTLFCHEEIVVLKLLFSLFDRRGKNYITSDDIASYAEEGEDYAQLREVDACMAALDADQDGQVGLVDYINFAARLKNMYILQLQAAAISGALPGSMATQVVTSQVVTYI